MHKNINNTYHYEYFLQFLLLSFNIMDLVLGSNTPSTKFPIIKFTSFSKTYNLMNFIQNYNSCSNKLYAPNTYLIIWPKN